MMKHKKHLIVLSTIVLLCLCLCLTACGKKNAAEREQSAGDITINENQGENDTSDSEKDAKPETTSNDDQAKDPKPETTSNDDQAKDPKPEATSNDKQAKGSKQDQAKVTYTGDGSGVEKIGSKSGSQQTTSSQGSGSSSKKNQKDNQKENPKKEDQKGSEKQEEIKHEIGVEPIGESKETSKPSKTKEPAAQGLSSAAQEYADYCGMSTDAQYAYYKKFKSADAFMNWYNAAKAAYEKENPTTVLEPGAAIDLGED